MNKQEDELDTLETATNDQLLAIAAFKEPQKTQWFECPIMGRARCEGDNSSEGYFLEEMKEIVTTHTVNVGRLAELDGQQADAGAALAANQARESVLAWSDQNPGPGIGGLPVVGSAPAEVFSSQYARQLQTARVMPPRQPPTPGMPPRYGTVHGFQVPVIPAFDQIRHEQVTRSQPASV